MHTATLKSGEGFASKAAFGPGPARQRFTGLVLQTQPGGAERGRAGLQEKHLGLGKHSQTNPNLGPWGKRGKAKAQHPRASTPLDPSAQMWGDTCGCPVEGWSLSAVMPVPPLGSGLFLGRKC